MASGSPAGIWQAPHRSLFLLAGLSALFAPAVWLLPDGLGPSPVEWHRHELLYGMGGAAVGGYLLTALAAWTGRPSAPAATRLVVLLWVSARIAYAADLSAEPVASLIYFAAIGAILLRGILAAAAWRRVPLALAPVVLGLSSVLPLIPGTPDPAAVQRLLPLGFALLVGIIGGRAISAFTRHWRMNNSETLGMAARLPAEPALFSRLPPALVAGAIVLLAAGNDRLAGLALLLSGGLQIGRPVYWRSWLSWRYPALAALHIAWLWLPTGLLLAGIALLAPTAITFATAIHALTMGAMGSMMIAIMGRAAMARRGSLLGVSPGFRLSFLLVTVSALPRLAVDFIDGSGPVNTLLQGACVLWMAGWALFLWDFRHALRGPVPRPVLSARARPTSEGSRAKKMTMTVNICAGAKSGLFAIDSRLQQAGRKRLAP